MCRHLAMPIRLGQLEALGVSYLIYDCLANWSGESTNPWTHTFIFFFFSLYYYSLWIKASSSRNTADQSSVNLSNVLLNLWSLLKDVRIAIEQYRSKPIVQSRLFYVWTWLPIRLLFWSPYCSRWRRWLPLVRQAGLRCAGAVLL